MGEFIPLLMFGVICLVLLAGFPGQDGWGYCVFGEVVAGQDVVDKIQSVETLNLGGHTDVPASPIIITKAFIQD